MKDSLFPSGTAPTYNPGPAKGPGVIIDPDQQGVKRPAAVAGDDQRLFLSLAEAGRLFGVGRCRAWEMARSGELPTVRIGRRWYVPRRAVDQLAEDALSRAQAVLAQQGRGE